MRVFINLANCTFILFAKAALPAGVYWNVPPSGFNELGQKNYYIKKITFQNAEE